MFQPSEIQGVVDVFELLEIKSEFWGGKPKVEPNTDPPPEPAASAAKEVDEQQTSWTSATNGQEAEEPSVNESVEPSGKECAPSCGSASFSESTSNVCAPLSVKTDVEEDVDVCSEEDTTSEKRRRRSSSSLFPVNLSLSNPDNKEHSNLNSPVSDRDSRVGMI